MITDLEVNTQTGAFRLTQCAGAPGLTGVGTITRKNFCVMKLVGTTDRAKVKLAFNACKHSAKATVKFLAPARTVKLVDSNTTDDMRHVRRR